MPSTVHSTQLPDITAITGALPSGPTRGPVRDWLAFQMGKMPGRLAQRFGGQRKVRPHHALLRAAVTETLRVFPDPVCIETGCVRDPNEGTDSTLVIASTLQGRGRFYTFELEPSHIDVCRVVCREYVDQITFVQGDAKANLREFAAEHDVVHFAFLDSAPDPGQIFAEFRAIEHRFTPGSVLIVDDAVRGNKGGRIKPYLHAHAEWETRLVFAGNGLLVAVKGGSSGA